MKLKELDGINKSELSMIEVAHAILEERNNIIDFNELLVMIQEYLEMSETVLEDRMANFYTDLNTDGRFISLGENRWGLREWYPIDSIDEEISSSIDDDETPTRRKKRKKKVNAFGDADDMIDYNDDDPEDSDVALDEEEDDDEDLDIDIDDDSDVESEEDTELDAYRSDLSEIGADEDIDDEVSVEEDLGIIDEDGLEDDYDDSDEEEQSDDEDFV